MGDRSQIAIKQPTAKDPEARIYLYGHWIGTDIYHALLDVLRRNERLDDPEYLTRMIFCRMVRGDESGATGFGIGNEAHGDIEHAIPVLNCRSRIISFENGETIPSMTFSEFSSLDPSVFEEW